MTLEFETFCPCFLVGERFKDVTFFFPKGKLPAPKFNE